MLLIVSWKLVAPYFDPEDVDRDGVANLNDIFPYTQDGLTNAISQAFRINEKEAETVLNSHRSLYLLSKSSEENANTLLSLTPIDKQSIVLLYNFLSN